MTERRAPGERATLAEWASDIGASERTVARLFRTELRTSYQQWRQQRLQQAVLAHALPMRARRPRKPGRRRQRLRQRQRVFRHVQGGDGAVA